MTSDTKVVLPSRRLNPELVDLIKSLKPGDKIEVAQTLRIGARLWTTKSDGVFRGISYLSTGVTTDRLPEDDIIVPTIHFEKAPKHELTSIALDEKTAIKRL
jgi:hypothetical protein